MLISFIDTPGDLFFGRFGLGLIRRGGGVDGLIRRGRERDLLEGGLNKFSHSLEMLSGVS